MVVARSWWEGGMESFCLMGTVSVWEVEKVLEMDGGDVCTTV